LPANISWRVHYAFFGRHGFTPAARELAAERKARLITLGQLEGDMGRWLRP
jgi:hypothetical protein